jgi:hypothetical protein
LERCILQEAQLAGKVRNMDEIPQSNGNGAALRPGEFGFVMLVAALGVGTWLRLFLAWHFFGNYDMDSYGVVSDIVVKGGNVYAETDRYNYSPLWFNLLGVLKSLNLHYPAIPFHFMVKAFLTLVDLVTALFLAKIASLERKPILPVVVLFYLNPVSILITGYHGQFENLAMLPVIAGIYLFLKCGRGSIVGSVLLWSLSTAGMIIKHNVFYEVIICSRHLSRRLWGSGLLFAVALAVFCLTFFPYLKQGSDGILRNVFMYSSQTGWYGTSEIVLTIKNTVLPAISKASGVSCSTNCGDETVVTVAKLCFLLGICLFPFLLGRHDLVRKCLLGTLFFVAFTTGMAVQYFVLPVALASLRISGFFLLYSLVTSIYIMGCPSNLNLPMLNQIVNANCVWVVVVPWFVVEVWKHSKEPQE